MSSYLSTVPFSEWMTTISAPLTPLSPALSAWMAAYDAISLVHLDVSAGLVTTSEKLMTVIISLARGILGCDEEDILLGASPPLLREPSPSALALSGPSALPAATTIDAKQIHHRGGEMQQIE
jgi:hypothetical protein